MAESGSPKGKSMPGQYSEYDNFAFHPYNVMLVLVLLAVSALFIATSIAFIFSRLEKPEAFGNIKIPWLFGVNTLILIGSSYTMWRAKKGYREDNTASYQQSLVLTLFLTLLFLVMQIIAWSQLFSQNVFIATGNSASYLYLLSGLHFVHVLAGLPFLYLFIRSAKILMKEPVTLLVYFSDPEKRLRLRLLSIYWHFLDGLWIFLVLFFFVNYLIG